MGKVHRNGRRCGQAGHPIFARLGGLAYLVRFAFQSPRTWAPGLPSLIFLVLQDHYSFDGRRRNASFR